MAKADLPWASKPVEIHCDMGEAFGNWTMGDDEAIMPHIDSCSIACGFHAGDPMVMYKTVKAAQRHNVRIGAHPSYLDLQGFGRREMKMDDVECEKMVIYQIGALKAFLDIEGIPLSHISVRNQRPFRRLRSPVFALTQENFSPMEHSTASCAKTRRYAKPSAARQSTLPRPTAHQSP